MSRKQKVVIINDSGQNFNELKQYGEFYVLTKGFLNLNDIRSLAYNLRPKLENIEPNDYIVVTGATTLSIIVVYYVIKKFGRIKIITFYKKGLKYVLQELSEEDIMGEK